MLYRENGQFKTSYRADQQIFPILQDRVADRRCCSRSPSSPCRCWRTEYLFRAILIPFLILSLAALGLNILVGYCGQISLGTGAFMAVGAYAAYNFHGAHRRHAAARCRCCSAGCARRSSACCSASRRLRIKGLYLAVATLAAQFFIDWAFLRINWFTNDSSSGSVSVAGLQVFGFPIETPVAEVPVLPGLRRACSRCWRRTWCAARIGREWMAIRDMDVAAAVIGIRPVYAKLTAFAVELASSSASPARCGASCTSARGSRRRSRIDRSFQLLFMVIIGGLGSIMGSFFGAAFIVLLPIVLDQPAALVRHPDRRPRSPRTSSS